MLSRECPVAPTRAVLPTLDRRRVLAGAGLALAAAAMVADPIALAAVPPPAVAAALPLSFDPGAFVDDLLDAGCRVTLHQPVPRWGGELVEPPYIVISRWHKEGLGAAYGAVMAKWTDAMDACPDHIERLTAYVAGQVGRVA